MSTIEEKEEKTNVKQHRLCYKRFFILMSIASLKHNWLMKFLHQIKHSDFQLDLAAFMLSNYYFLNLALH